jgi:hypothetical protein
VKRLTYRQAVDRAQRSHKFQTWRPRRVFAKTAAYAKEILTGEPARHEEKHYSPSELAKMWALSPDTIRKLFEGETDVLKVKNTNSSHKRRYVTLRIPESVAIRVHRKMSC